MFTVAILSTIIFGAQQADVPFAKGLGTHTRTIATTNPLAQKYFNQGLAYYYGFNHGASRRSFQAAATVDPHCAMAYWGIAMTCGPNINDPEVDPERAKIAWDALQKAEASDAEILPGDKPLIDALAARFVQDQPADRSPLDKAYADKMKEAWAKEPMDGDIGCLYAESLMDLRPWHQWNLDGTPAPDTEDVITTLNAVLKLDINHPMANHLLIHAVEGSPHPELGLDAANRLRDLEPGLGHMVHMPSHIYVRTGNWKDAIIANRKAIAMDNSFLAKNPHPGFYAFYMAHNRAMLAYACMMRGQSKEAIQAVADFKKLFTRDEMEAQAPFFDTLIEMPYELMVRFGKWDEILSMPSEGPKFPLTEAFRLAARGVAYAAKHQPEKARIEQAAFREAAKKVPDSEMLAAQNAPASVLNIEDNLLEGEILYQEGKVDEAVAALRKAVQAEDQQSYDEPPDWLTPTRHALGAVLLDAGRFQEALDVCQQDLKIHPNNGWALMGITRACHGLGKHEDAKNYQGQFDKVWADADMTITSSCMCLPAKR